jgi:AcrR family transcriptional regulator
MGRNSLVSTEKILESARGLFAKYGFSKTTIEDIAKSLRVGKSSLYYYFKDKEGILKAVIDYDIGRIKERVIDALKKAPTPQEKLRIYTIMRMTFFKEYTAVYNAFIDEYLSHYSFIQKLRAGYDAYEESLIFEILKEGVESGVFSILDVKLASSTIFAAIKGMEFDWANRFETSTIEKNIDALFGILLNGIMKR